MRIQVRPIGQRLAIVLDDAMLEQLGIGPDSVLELSMTADDKGIEVRPVDPAILREEKVKEFHPVQLRLAPKAKRLLAFLQRNEGQFFERSELKLGRKLANSSKSEVFITCGRVLFYEPRTVLLRGRMGYLPADQDVASFQPDWSFRPLPLERSPRSAKKDNIVLRLLQAHPGRYFDRDQLYDQLHDRWRGAGGIVQRDADISAARLGFGHPMVEVRGGKLGWAG